MTDRGTYLAYRDKLDLVVIVEGDPRLFNPYGVIAVNPARHPHVRYEEAMEFIGWLTNSEAQGIIGGFLKGGELLFHPDAVPLLTEH
jgi:tungstate transport system substrate-binding protein